MPRFASGVVKFQDEVYPEKRALFEKLSAGQSPEALFVTCSDSRIDANLITQTDPGELFICRNAGNIIPPYTDYTGAMTASIELAVTGLNVPHIVICGHTDCAAMHGALQPERLDGLPHVKEWLGYTQKALDRAQALGEGNDAAAIMRLLLEQNVILQLAHLKEHPSVAARLAAGDIRLHGWIYDIKAGDVSAYDDANGAFVPVADYYAAEIAALARPPATP